MLNSKKTPNTGSPAAAAKPATPASPAVSPNAPRSAFENRLSSKTASAASPSGTATVTPPPPAIKPRKSGLTKALVAGFACVALLAIAAVAVREFSVVWMSPKLPILPDAPVPSLVEASCLYVPVTIQLSEVEPLVNASAPDHLQGTHNSDTTVPHPHFHGALRRPTVTRDPLWHIDWQVSRDHITLGTAGDRVTAKIPVHAHAEVIPSGAQARVDGIANGSSSLDVDGDFNLKPAMDLHLDLDKFSLLGINLTGLAQNIANGELNRFKGQIADKVSQAVNLRAKTQKAWDSFPESFRLPGVSNSWVRIVPKGVALEGPHASDGVVSADLVLLADTECFFQSNQPAAAARVPLPSLSRELPADRRFHLRVPVETDVGELDRLLSTAVRHGPVFKIADKATVTLTGASLLGEGNRLFVSVNFEADPGFWKRRIKGTLILGARPVMEPVAQKLKLTDVEFTAETTNTFINSAAWLLQPAIVHEIQNRLVVDVSDYLKQAAVLANQRAGQLKLPPPLQMTLNLEQPTVKYLAVHGQTIFTEFDAAGKLAVSYGQ